MSHLGLIGLGTMGENLVRNIVSKDESIVVWNRTLEKVIALQSELSESIIVWETISDLITKTEVPRNIFLLVPAWKATDEVAQTLFELLSPGDAIWDLGNAHWDTTIAHQSEASQHGIHWIGCGISGGSEWARLWPAMMPGGDKASIDRMLPILQKISAKDFAGNPCVTYVWAAAAGNFVKMVHNGIEYGMMQAIAEGFEVFEKSGYDLDFEAIAQLFNQGSVIRGWLMELTANAFSKDPKLESIKGKMFSSGEGRWTLETALDLGVPTPVIALSLLMRYRSLQDDTFTGKVVAALRNEFGGHAVEKA